jgi:hypothetical protein
MRPYSGHAPGHVRDTFCDAIDAFMGWNEGEPEPTVEFEIGYEPRHVTISEACALVWNCTDILPRIEFDSLYCDAGLPLKRRTYAAAAQAMLAEIKRTREHVGA